MSDNTVSSRRIIQAMRDCRKDHGQGYSLDYEALKTAQKQGLLTFIQWPAGFWKITDKGLNYIEAHETSKGE